MALVGSGALPYWSLLGRNVSIQDNDLATGMRGLSTLLVVVDDEVMTKFGNCDWYQSTISAT